jgi:hypothetical protein
MVGREIRVRRRTPNTIEIPLAMSERDRLAARLGHEHLRIAEAVGTSAALEHQRHHHSLRQPAERGPSIVGRLAVRDRSAGARPGADTSAVNQTRTPRRRL